MSAPEAELGPVTGAVLAELEALGIDPRADARAATALELARRMDAPRTSPTAASMCAKAIHEAMDRLLELNPPKPEANPLDQLMERRAARRAAASG